jgi:2',3'-cyclic-nucleotide 2'-phosphodiesterase (5'-nucleotidase family)
MRFERKLLLTAILGAAVTATPAWAHEDDDDKHDSDAKELTIIHIGDIHGHTIPRPNLRSDGDGRMEGGLARMYTEIRKIREHAEGKTLLINTGDTIQGSGEAVYSRGQALVDVLDMFKINAYTPGNWDFVYGPDRFKELFVGAPDANGNPTSKRWGGLVSNVYETGVSIDPAAPPAPPEPNAIGSPQDSNLSAAEYDAYATWYLNNGKRILPPYAVKKVNGVKVGIIGCTTSRGPQVVGKWVTEGLSFTDCSREVPKFAEELRTQKGVDLVVLISEIEIGRNIQLVKSLNANQHIDAVLNSDMHEETIQPIEVTDAAGNKTLIIEEGQDGTMIGELTFRFADGLPPTWTFKPHRIHDGIRKNDDVAEKVAKVRAPYTTKFDEYKNDPVKREKYHKNFFSGTYLNGSLDEVVGSTQVGLHRSNYSHEDMPAAVEGSSHDFIADAIRWWAKADLGTVRGFRYGTHVKPGPITRNDLFHFVPIGPRVGKVSRITLNQLRNQVDNSSLVVFSSDPNNPVTPRPSYNNPLYAPGGANQNASPGAGLPVQGLSGNTLGFGGGWLFSYSADGFHMDFDPYFVPSWQKVKAAGAPGAGIDLSTNAQTTAPAGDTSRARSLTVKMPCKYLPPAEIVSTGCDVNDTATRYATVMTAATDGKYTAAWVTNYGTGVNAVPGYAARDTWLLNPDGWQFLKGTPNNPNGVLAVKAPFQAPTFTAAGYFYAQSPNTLNNCNNCYPTGYSTTVGHPDAAYLLPVNVGADGNAALDADGNPIYVRDGDGNVIMENSKPKIEGEPIDLTVVMEKYLAHLGEVTASNLPLNRIGLLKPLPASTTGFNVMQPLCGTIGQDSLAPNVCP